MPVYTMGQPWETAIAQGVRMEFAEMVKDLVRRGLSALDADAEERRRLNRVDGEERAIDAD